MRRRLHDRDDKAFSLKQDENFISCSIFHGSMSLTLEQNGGTKTIMKRIVILYLHDAVKLAFVRRSKNLHQIEKSFWHDSSLLRSRYKSRDATLLEERCVPTLITYGCEGD